MFNACFQQDSNGLLMQWCWPYEGSYMDQPHLIVSGFSIIKYEAQVQINKKIEQKQKQKKGKRG